MIWAYVHNGDYNGWHRIDYNVYQLIKNPVRGNETFLLPRITAVIKVK